MIFSEEMFGITKVLKYDSKRLFPSLVSGFCLSRLFYYKNLSFSGTACIFNFPNYFSLLKIFYSSGWKIGSLKTASSSWLPACKTFNSFKQRFVDT